MTGRAEVPSATRPSLHSGQSFEQVKRDIDRDKFMTAEEAQTYGIIDGVIVPRRGLGLVPLAV